MKSWNIHKHYHSRTPNVIMKHEICAIIFSYFSILQLNKFHFKKSWYVINNGEGKGTEEKIVLFHNLGKRMANGAISATYKKKKRHCTVYCTKMCLMINFTNAFIKKMYVKVSKQRVNH